MDHREERSHVLWGKKEEKKNRMSKVEEGLNVIASALALAKLFHLPTY